MSNAHNQIMNLPISTLKQQYTHKLTYEEGHRDARHAAAEIAAQAVAEKDAEITELRKRMLQKDIEWQSVRSGAYAALQQMDKEKLSIYSDFGKQLTEARRRAEAAEAQLAELHRHIEQCPKCTASRAAKHIAESPETLDEVADRIENDPIVD